MKKSNSMQDADAKKSIVIIVRGLPGSGKTHLAIELQKALSGQKVLMLDPDATDYESKDYIAHTKSLSAEGVDSKLHAYRFLRGKAYNAIAAGEIIIWNQPFTNLEIFDKMTANLYAEAVKHNVKLSILVVEVEIDPETARTRVTKRKESGGHGPSDATFERFNNDYHSFADHGYNTITVHGDNDVSDSVRYIVDRLDDILANR